MTLVFTGNRWFKGDGPYELTKAHPYMVVQLAFRTAMRLMLGQATLGRYTSFSCEPDRAHSKTALKLEIISDWMEMIRRGRICHGWASLIPLGLVDSRAGLCFEVVGKATTTFFSLGHHLLNEATIKV
ncbi:hypothetical protein VNO77_44652 [Canavalia gladiata]|uniref:Uncharacterized protein n=1 Tax=Canavalia gladiata TaxID=3824 RepID=A0AAN9JZC3_CANGL